MNGSLSRTNSPRRRRLGALRRSAMTPGPSLRRGRARLLTAGLCLAAAAAPAAAGRLADSDRHPVLPGIGATDPRIRIDPNTVPWRAVGKLQATAGGLYESCTGTL